MHPELGLPALLMLLYGVGLRCRRRGRWPRVRTAWFALGCLLLAGALMPGMQAWSHASPSGHMAQHLLLGMFAPLPLMLGRPGTLILRCLSPLVARRWLGLLGSAPIRLLTHPVTALLLDIGGLYVLYLTPLFHHSLHDPLLHGWLMLHFVVAGYLYSWAIAGADPAPHRPGFRLRLVVLFVGTAAHALLAKLMYGLAYPRGTGASLDELQAAAKLMYYGGDLAELLLAVALFHLWSQARQRRLRPPADGLYTRPRLAG
ncbi:cytochrome c oxidase assembly protein [Stutzerimonas urumqiensis]|uniref:cytochrome c oxidase assembly protein n=1 Tax=Stutzerimonas urumqiensis TaxID=638269 RepID=UPI003BACFBD8